MTSRPPWYQAALEAPSHRGNVEVDSTSIKYEVWGEVGNPGVALIHGSNAHLEWWRFVAPFLADQFRVVALDLSGNGDSGWRPRYDGQLFAEETWAVCAAAELGERPFVVGHSFGGFVALETGHHYGPDLGGIIMNDFTVAPPEQYTEWGRRAETENVKPRQTRVYDSLETALGRFRLLPDQPALHPYVIEHVARHSLRQVEGGWTWKFDPTLFDHLEMGASQRDKFATLACRSALILGESSDDEGAQSADYMREITAGKIPVFSIPGTHHHMMFEEPIALTMAIKGVLLAWVMQDGEAEMAAALARVRSED